MQNSWCWKYSAISIYQVITATLCCCAVMQVRRSISKSSGEKLLVPRYWPCLLIQKCWMYRISLKNWWCQSQKCKNLNSFPFLYSYWFFKWRNYSRGDTSQGGILIKEIKYLPKLRGNNSTMSPSICSDGPAMKICSTFGIFGKPTTTTNARCHHLVDDGWVILQICKSAWKNIFLS